MHRAIREHFPQLESKTEDGDDPDGKVINIQFVGKKTNQRGKIFPGMYTQMFALSSDKR